MRLGVPPLPRHCVQGLQAGEHSPGWPRPCPYLWLGSCCGNSRKRHGEGPGGHRGVHGPRSDRQWEIHLLPRLVQLRLPHFWNDRRPGAFQSEKGEGEERRGWSESQGADGKLLEQIFRRGQIHLSETACEESFRQTRLHQRAARGRCGEAVEFFFENQLEAAGGRHLDPTFCTWPACCVCQRCPRYRTVQHR